MSDKYAVPNKLPGKTVSVLTHRKRRIHHEKAAIEQKKNEKTKRIAKVKQHHQFKRAESFVMGYLKAERLSKRMKQQMVRTNLAKNCEKKAEETNQNLILVMRHAGKKIFEPTVDKVFRTLGMPRRHNAVFLQNTKENQILLKLIEPFVAYGYPSITTVRELLFKKGFARINGKKTAIQSNAMVEEHLGEHGVICLEDIIHEIFTVGPNFSTVTKFLCPFLLSSPRDGWQKKVSVSFKRGGEYGDRGDLINQLISRCL